MTVIALASIKELLAQTRAWHECHWTHGRSDEAAEKYFSTHGLKTDGVTVFHMPFGYCYPIEVSA